MRRITSGSHALVLLVGISIVPSAAAQSRPIGVCVVANGKLQEVAADYNPATGDTTVAGKAFSAVYPSGAAHYAAKQSWFVENDLVNTGGSFYSKYGLPRVLGVSEVVARGAYQGVPLFVEPDAATPAEIFYAPVRTGCEFQPYQIEPGVAGEIGLGETRTGSLVHDEPKEDNHHYQKWLLRGRAGDVIDVSLESDDFDAYLEVMPEGLPLAYSDDDGGGDLNSLVHLALPADGRYTILVTTVDEEEIGNYALRVTRPAWAASLGTRRVLLAGKETRGRIVAADVQDGGGKRQAYLYSASDDEAITFELASDDFDARISVGRMEGTRFVELAEDDDGGDGTDSRLEFEFPEPGVYVVRVESLDGANGDYTLSAGGIPVIALGEMVNAELSGREAEIEDGHFSDEYEYLARKGERIVIDLSSSDFDVLVYLGEQIDDDFNILASDDDGAGGTNSRLEFTFPEEGYYYIGVTSAGKEETGEYTLTVRSK
jgi:hypothetical protein